MSKILRLQRAALLASCAIAALGGSLLASRPAAAQFICVGNATGALVPPGTADGAGATAAGSGNNVACGPFANASGDNAVNTAIGLQANASGVNGSNTATGTEANASGISGTNTATGYVANASGDGSFNIATG